ncbi:MAG: thiamine pyrophosphate-dependent enzyme [Haloarculaceae archaeon]
MTEPNPPRGERADQTEASAALVEETPDAAFIANLGTASYHLIAAADRARNFYLTGAMGCTTPVGLGLSMAIDEQVTVLDGDGSMLMGLGALATVASVDPSNLVIVVMNNAAYETTGGQLTHSPSTDYAAVAEDCGLVGWTVSTVDDLREAYAEARAHDGAALVNCKVEAGPPEEYPDLDYGHAAFKSRFRAEFVD